MRVWCLERQNTMKRGSRVSCLANLTLPSYISRNTFSYPEIFWKIKNGRLPLAAFSLPLPGWKFFKISKTAFYPMGDARSPPPEPLNPPSYSWNFPGNETGDIPHGCLHIWDGCPIFAVVIFSFSSYFGTIIFDFRIIGWVQCSPYSLLPQSSSPW